MPGESISNYWITTKRIGKGVMGVGGTAISAAQFATGTGTIALMTGAAAASATGVGLVVAGAAITVATCGMSGYSAYKTGKHLAVLEKIYERKNAWTCSCLQGVKNTDEHNHIADDVLPYIILQKAEKQARKTVGAIPVLGSGSMGLYSMGRAFYKTVTGTRGKMRTAMATDLTRHLLTHDCSLAQAIVAELYSFEELLWLLGQDPDTVIPLLSRKMASN